jgi:hypothetical protein
MTMRRLGFRLAMIFVSCRDGISDKEAQFSSEARCGDGAWTLLQAVLDYARPLAEHQI